MRASGMRSDIGLGPGACSRTVARPLWPRAAGRQQLTDIRLDWLLSYQPRPGTVAFVGYGSSMTEDDQFRFRHLQRTADGFFLKLSYVFRR
jgi:hypothetical protein